MKRQNRHIDYQCRNCDAQELAIEEEGLLPPAPAAVPVNAGPPAPEGAVIQELGGLPNQALPPLDLRVPLPPLQPIAAPQASQRCDVRIEDVPFGPQLLVEPEMTEEEARLQDSVPVTFKFLPTGSKQGKPLVVSSDGYAYAYKRKMKNGAIVYMCTVRPRKGEQKLSCNASVTRSLRQQEDDDDTYTRNAVDHNHEANASHAFGRETYAYVKANAVPLFDVPTASLRQRAIDQAFPEGSVHNAPRACNVDRAIQKMRQHDRPQEPRTVDEPLNNDWLTVHCPDMKVLVDRQGAGGTRIIAFSTSFLLQKCSEASKWFLDGTFKVFITCIINCGNFR